MNRHLYLSLIPESLVASQLSPEEFGSYYAIGSRKRSRGQAIFFEIDPEWDGQGFKMEEANKRCVAHKDGTPRRSVYISIYRVLEQIPLEAIGKLYLTTGDGRVLALDQAPYDEIETLEHHLYHELCPITPVVVSDLSPNKFVASLTDPSKAVSVHTIAFCEMILSKLARDPESENVGDLPYPNIGHLRDCIMELEAKPRKTTKTVSRGRSSELMFRTIKNGFFVGNQDRTLYYPIPSREKLEREHYEWWRSALIETSMH